jgi:glycosyltransferase involved in cell wall biosynthesis
MTVTARTSTPPITPLRQDLQGLRILVTLDAVGGVWRYAVDLASGLRARGARVLFLGFGPAPDARRLAEASRIGPVGWQPAPLDWMAGGPDDLVPARETIARLCRVNRIDLLHLNTPPLAAGGALGVPTVAVTHSCLATWHRAVRGGVIPRGMEWHGGLYAAGLRAAQAVVAPSQAHADLLRTCYGDLPPVAVVPNAVVPAAPIREEPRMPVAIAAGRWWDPGKNGATLDTGAARMRTPLCLVGPITGPQGEVFEASHAKVLGELPHASLRRLMARARVFVSPPRFEPFGLAVAEAAQAGLPLVLSDIPTFRELWSDAAAVFVAPDDARALAKAVDALAADPDRAARMGAAARAEAARYRPERQVAAMAKLYRDVLARTVERKRRSLP